MRVGEKDIIIAEDDPYYILQIGEYVAKSERKAAAAADDDDDDVARFVASLIPSYLRIDTQGRVIRMDTFSKVRFDPVPLTPLSGFSSFITLRRRSHRVCDSAGSRAVRSSQSA
jgi:hypothetical protein